MRGRAGGRAVHYHRFAPVVRGGASQLGAPGFGTERARLVVQVERLRCTRLQHRTCKTSRSSKKASLRRFAAYRGTSLRSWFQKKCLLPMGISIFFFENTSDFETWSWIFFHKKSFWNFSPKYSELSSYKLIMTEVSRILRNIFFPKYPRFWKLKLDFCPLKKVFEIFCPNILNHLSLN